MTESGRPRLLILSASTGNGHISAALAVESVALAHGLEAKAVDTLQITPKAFKLWYGGGYEAVVRTRPELWGHLYKISDYPRAAYYFQNVLDTVFVAKIGSLIRKYRPDIIVCTHSLPQPQLARLRRKYSFKIAIVVTDMYPHLMWLRGRPDHYFVPSEWSKNILLERTKTKPQQITISGIPIDPAFAAPEAFVPTTPPTVMITVGGIGAGPLGEATEAIAKIPTDCRIVAICGRNEGAKRRLQNLVDELPESQRARVEVRGHVARPDMVTLMHESSLLVGKPGGLTTSEALAAGVPFVVYSPFMIPGQEEGNAEFLNEKGAGVIVETPEDLGKMVDTLLNSPERVAAMRAAAVSLGLPQAAETIVNELCELYRKDGSKRAPKAVR